jgi:transcription elongation factor SPT6
VPRNALLSTSPTPAGEATLDPFHPLGIAKHLTSKRVTTLEGSDTWLRVLEAERQGLVRVTLEWPESAKQVGHSMSCAG